MARKVGESPRPKAQRPGTVPLVGAGAARSAADPRTRRADQALAGSQVATPPLLLDELGRLSIALGPGLGLVEGRVAVLTAGALALVPGSPLSMALRLGPGLGRDRRGRLRLALDASRVRSGSATLAVAMRTQARRSAAASSLADVARVADEVRAVGARALEAERLSDRLAHTSPLMARRFA